ncbi:3-oxoacyl-ACP reductase FabG [Patescibacteria group bacterium]|nr:3-oxoacyl-ACP reductase FabG [Patescibacteria group bacterium]
MFDLTGKVALVTGASSGIGRGIAFALASQGAKVSVAARRLDRLEALSAELKGRNHDVLPLKMDVTVRTEVDAAVAKTIETYGHLDILVNNAGALDYSPFLEMTEEKWDLILDTNLKGYFFMAQAAAREMAKRNSGRIINIASVASGGVGIGFPQLVHYCASKGGVVAMTEALAAELGQYNILVNAVGPGGIESEMTRDMDAGSIAGRLSVKRLGKPAEIAAAVVYLASDEASYTTGATLYVDGGWLAQ